MPVDRHARRDQRDSADKIEPALAADNTEPALAAEPTEKMEATEATEPIDRTDPAEPMHRIEPAEPIDKIDPLDPMLRSEPEEPARRGLSVFLILRFSHHWSISGTSGISRARSAAHAVAQAGQSGGDSSGFHHSSCTSPGASG